MGARAQREQDACLDLSASMPGSSASKKGSSASKTGSSASTTGSSANTTGWSASTRGWSASTLRGARAQPVGALQGMSLMLLPARVLPAEPRPGRKQTAAPKCIVRRGGPMASRQRVRLAPCERGPPAWARRRVRGARWRVARAGGAVRCARAQQARRCMIACMCRAWHHDRAGTQSTHAGSSPTQVLQGRAACLGSSASTRGSWASSWGWWGCRRDWWGCTLRQRSYTGPSVLPHSTFFFFAVRRTWATDVRQARQWAARHWRMRGRMPGLVGE